VTTAVPTDVSPSTFEGLSIDPRLIDAVGALGFESPTPIQAEAIPPLVSGRDVIGRARTGSGKTAAFGLPVLERVKAGGKSVKALLLCPTRELALQVTDALRSYAAQLPVRVVTLYGGASYGPQLKALSQGVSVVVGTPGRVLDHLERGTLDLTELELFVLDEADEMLRMGFIDDVEKLLAATPKGRQVALFSATMPPPIKRIAKMHLNEPLIVQVESEELTTAHIAQRGVLVPNRNKLEALQRVLSAEPRGATLVFARTRAGCAEAASYLAQRGLRVDALHGDLNQQARELVVTRLRANQLDVVVATDVAARGLDVEHLTHVVNLDLPNDPETYVHRIGRTGRAGRKGVAIAFVAPSERGRIRRFQDTLGVKIERMDVPSDADILAARRARLVASVVDAKIAPSHLALADELDGDARREHAQHGRGPRGDLQRADVHDGDEPDGRAVRVVERRAEVALHTHGHQHLVPRIEARHVAGDELFPQREDVLAGRPSELVLEVLEVAVPAPDRDGPRGATVRAQHGDERVLDVVEAGEVARARLVEASMSTGRRHLGQERHRLLHLDARRDVMQRPFDLLRPDIEADRVLDDPDAPAARLDPVPERPSRERAPHSPLAEHVMPHPLALGLGHDLQDSLDGGLPRLEPEQLVQRGRPVGGAGLQIMDPAPDLLRGRSQRRDRSGCVPLAVDGRSFRFVHPLVHLNRITR